MNCKHVHNLVTVAGAIRLMAIAALQALVGMAGDRALAATLRTSLETGVFDTTTTVDFTLIETHNKNQSNFGVLNVAKNAFTSLFAEIKAWDTSPSASGQKETDWLGTCGNTILNCSTTFTFEATKQYKLGFWDGTSLYSLFKAVEDSYTYTTTSEDYVGQPAYKTVSGFQVVYVGAEDGSYKQNRQSVYDYQDFVISASQQRRTIPEPASLAGLGLVVGAIAFSRRRKSAGTSGN